MEADFEESPRVSVFFGFEEVLISTTERSRKGGE